MSGKQRTIGGTALLLLIAACVYWIGFRNRFPALELHPVHPRPGSLDHGLAGPIKATLVPLSADSTAHRDDPILLWKNSFAAMTDDRQTEALLSDLCGGLRVKIAILPEGEDGGTFHKIPLESGYDLALRVRNTSAELGKSLAQGEPEIPYLAVAFEFSSTVPSHYSKGEGLRESQALRLAMEEHFLRRSKGWRLIWERGFDDGYVASLVKQSPGVVELRADLDRRLKEHAARSKALRATQDGKQTP